MSAPFRLKAPEPLETDIQASILKALSIHPAVARAWRQNTGAGRLTYPDGKTSRFVRFSEKGSPDIHGYLKDGRALFVEVKRRQGTVTPEQQAFIDDAAKNGCLAFIARSSADVWSALDNVKEQK
jgi:hypothetical protein